DRHDVLALREDPRQGELSGRAAFAGGEVLEPIGDREVFGKILALKARRSPAIVVFREVFEPLNLSSEKAPTQRTVSDKSDAEFATRRQHVVFWIARPQGVLRL